MTGKYQASERPSGATRLGEDPERGDGYDFRNTERTYAILGALQTIADNNNRPVSHVALAWVASRPGVASVLLGARTIEQLKDNLAAADFQPSQAELDELTRISSITSLPYPYNFLEERCDMDVWRTLGT